jgi:ATP-dependent Lhr-like helicase
LYLTDFFPLLAPLAEPTSGELAQRIRELLHTRGAQFFSDLVRQLGGFPNEVFDTVWEMVWAGEVSNDTLRPVASLMSSKRGPARASQRPGGRQFRSRRSLLPGTEGRWTLLDAGKVTPTERTRAHAEQLVKRHGVLTRDAVRAEAPPGGFSLVYPVLDALEHAGRVRRGYFIAALGATQFAAPGAEAWLRRHREADPSAGVQILSACDPSNPWGACFPWPEHASVRPQRAVGCHVLLRSGDLLAFVGKGQRSITLFPPTVHGNPPIDASGVVADALLVWLQRGTDRLWLLENIDGHSVADLVDAARSPQPLSDPGSDPKPRAVSLLQALLERGHTLGAKGVQLRRSPAPSSSAVQRPN